MMKEDNRTLGRIGARELTREETENTIGGIITMTFACTTPSPKYPKTTDTDHEGCPS